MATIKKTATKTVKKPAAKKPAAKKPAVKKAAAVKKPAAKKPAVKKAAAAKKPAVKTAVKKSTAVKKPAAAKKPAVKKAAIVKKPPAVKTAATKVSGAKKTAVIKKAEVSNSAKRATEKPVNVVGGNVKYRNLFEAYSQKELPFAHGYIISSFFDEKSAYSIYEIVSYAGVKEIFPTSSGLQFISGGKKLHILVEPDTYPKKFIEPVSRVEGEKIPKRFNELDTVIAKNQTKIYISKTADETPGSFTILTPHGMNFSVVFYEMPDMYSTITEFFKDSLNRQRRVPESDAKKASLMIVKTIESQMNFKGDFE
ncbi:MAG: hypothetical protein FWC19_07760 [Treponema sp.]|nr:hypothetical protein [Treponema sp.]MCL2272677.1 hypothetical protein [Treponema sp.]